MLMPAPRLMHCSHAACIRRHRACNASVYPPSLQTGRAEEQQLGTRGNETPRCTDLLKGCPGLPCAELWLDPVHCSAAQQQARTGADSPHHGPMK